MRSAMLSFFVSLVVTVPVNQVSSQSSGAAPHAPATTPTLVVLLGTRTPNADPYRSGPSIAIVVNDTPYLVDFGPGVVRRAAAAFQNGIKGLAVKNLNRAFV